MYWGSLRRHEFGVGVRDLARHHRQDMVIVVQSYSRARLALGPSVHMALRTLRIDYADILLLGLWDKPPPKRILDRALGLREAGKVRHIVISSHHRPSFRTYIDDPLYGGIMIRYNAAHRGAEREVFPQLAAHVEPPGVIAYTATRWGRLLDPRFTPTGDPTPRARDCYRFALSSDNVDVCLSGPGSIEQLDDALAALKAPPMDDSELAWMRRVGDAVYLGTASESGSVPSRMWQRLSRTHSKTR